MQNTITAERFRLQTEHLLEGLDIRLNGERPWDIQVHDERLYARVISQGSLGLGEAYMDGWWDCEALDELVARLLRSDIRSKLKPSFNLVIDAITARTVNRQNKRRAFQVGERHYDIGNELYQAMLDKRMTYTCGYWNKGPSTLRNDSVEPSSGNISPERSVAESKGLETMSDEGPSTRSGNITLDEAQEAKLDLVCRKIGLEPGDKVLDIGCGWGSFAKFAAERYGASVVGVTVSKEQLKLGQELCKGLPIEFRLQDYREVNEPFDHIVSLGMFEHVGYKNYREYFQVVRRCLKDDGLFLLHTIGGNKSGTTSDAWILKYIFPNSMIPSATQITRACEGLFVMEDWHNFSVDYDKTLLAWSKNIESRWPELGDKYDERFRRMWRFYLLSCAGSFRSRVNQLWQIVYSKKGLPDGYSSIR